MSRIWLLASVTGILLTAAGTGRAQDARAVLVRAVQAHGGEAALTRFGARHVKIRGILTGNQNLPFTHELFYQGPQRVRDVLTVEAEGRKTTIVYGLNGDEGWMQVNGQPKAVPAEMLTELKESAHLVRMSGLGGVLAADTQATLLPAVQVGGRPALGVRIAVKGHREIGLYFDREMGLLVKAEHDALDAASRKMVKEERFYGAWKEVNGLKIPTRVEVLRDGKKFMQAESTEVEVLERLEDGIFTRP
jgi:hypothetical protein